MTNNSIGVAELFHLLESNKLNDVEETKKVFHDHFLSTKDNWLVNGLFDYYLSTNSLRAIEVLSGVREPHDKHLLDRITETIAKPATSAQRVQALTVLGHVARRQPTWLYKLTNHSLFKELLKLLKVETDALSMLGLYSLFHRLYAMYPCNLITYLRLQYSQRDHDETFKYTIKPILDSVRMHPLLITASKDAETNAARWKKMEHHDVVAECGRFALDRSREEILGSINPRATPILDQQGSYTPVSVTEGLLESGASNGMEEDTFWSPSMVILPQSPTPIQASSHEPRSAPSTPNNNRSNASPPEAAIEATPETTPVKDMRQLSIRAPPIGSAAVRALTALGNGGHANNSRPSTPIITNTNFSAFVVSGIGSGDGGGLLSQKINRLVTERQNVLQSQKSFNIEGIGKMLDNNTTQNGKNDSWNEDQEVLEIVNSRGKQLIFAERVETIKDDRSHNVRMDNTRKIKRKKIHLVQVRRSVSCPEILKQKKFDEITENITDVNEAKSFGEVSTQTTDLVPYEHLLTGILEQRCIEQQKQHENSDSTLSPSSMLDRYIEACARVNSTSNDQLKCNRKKGVDEDDTNEEIGLDQTSINQQLQLMQMQLLFERQRREVHAERNRRLLGKLRDSRALEEHNAALTDRLRMARNEIDGLKSEMDRIKKDSRLADSRNVEALQHWQSKCIEEQQQNRLLHEHVEILELELKKERKKITECEQQTREAEAALFDAAHKLKDALKAASRGEEYKRNLDNVRKRFLLLGETQIKLQERVSAPVLMSRQETAQIQKAYNEELSSLRRQLESRMSLAEVRKVRLAELEAREERKEKQLVELQRLLQEAKERNAAELRAVESKYKAQVEINLLLENRILELHGLLEAATSGSGTTAVNVMSSASPKERSPPLSGSLASSSEGSLAFHTGTSIMSDCCDSAGEIANLQAIVEPTPTITNQTTTTPLRSASQRRK
ncbi:hypothetical protein PV328_001325 [Microctonus aethiopoides]|uniref:Hamartin n=1 Tax=Microctonus aethiopoides TaxID=144406 RepID=A0AA39FX24_9HYME|nr:hypothetical protein PV328_001325 [Microctonus aethiopoides]